ncbi:hypothetical protein ES705_38871 [subsurface metagenome]
MAIRTKEFYKFQNRVLEKLSKTYLSQNDNKYCWVLFRETFGYGNLKAKILGVRISELTGILKTHVSRTEQRLKERNIIIVSGKYKGFNPDISKWQKLPLPVTFKKLPLPVLKVTATGTKKLPLPVSPLSTKERKLQEGGVGLKKLEIKEVEKLEGKKWLRQVMWQSDGFSIKFIDEIFEIYSFMQCYDTYIAYQEAHNVRDKEAWFLAKLRRGPETEE